MSRFNHLLLLSTLAFTVSCGTPHSFRSYDDSPDAEALGHAIVRRDETAVLNLIKLHPSLVNERWIGYVPLILAIDNVRLVTMLLESGARVDVDGEHGTPLGEAARHGNLVVIELLLDHGANPGTPDKFGDTPLHKAACSGSVDAIRYFINLGLNVNARNKQGETPLWLAAYNSDEEAVGELLAHGANINAANKKGTTPMHWAAFQNEVEMGAYLLDHGADPSARDQFGYTPLRLATKYESPQFADFLKQRGIRK